MADSGGRSLSEAFAQTNEPDGEAEEETREREVDEIHEGAPPETRFRTSLLNVR
jgi:hypothetical protein